MKSKSLITLILVTISIGGFSQEISFIYDEFGNRTGRKLLVIGKIDNENTADNDQNSSQHKNVVSFDKNQVATIDDVTVKVTPNPNEGKFIVSITNLREVRNAGFYLHSVSGTLVYECNDPSDSNSVDISSSEKGTYILTVVINGTKEAWKVIKL